MAVVREEAPAALSLRPPAPCSEEEEEEERSSSSTTAAEVSGAFSPPRPLLRPQ